MVNLQGMHDIYRTGMDKELIWVKDYWIEGRGNEEWREWKSMEDWNRNAMEEQKTLFSKELESRKIKNRGGNDVL